MTSPRIVMGSLAYVFYDNQVLLLKRANPPYQGYWSPPGGKMEFGESPHDCCIREIAEETGLHISSPELRAIQTVVDVEIPIHWQLFAFRIYLNQAPNTLSPHPDHQEGELRWFGLDELPNIKRPYTDQQYWGHLISDNPSIWQGKFEYDTPDKLTAEQVY